MEANSNPVLTTEADNTNIFDVKENGIHEQAKLRYLKVENTNLYEKMSDLQTTLSINKEIITALSLGMGAN